jgi:hypothetical protein
MTSLVLYFFVLIKATHPNNQRISLHLHFNAETIYRCRYFFVPLPTTEPSLVFFPVISKVLLNSLGVHTEPIIEFHMKIPMSLILCISPNPPASNNSNYSNASNAFFNPSHWSESVWYLECVNFQMVISCLIKVRAICQMSVKCISPSQGTTNANHCSVIHYPNVCYYFLKRP